MSSSTFTAEQAHAAVARGAAWLDKHCPDWFKEINLETLDLADPQYCVLGQTAECIMGKSRTSQSYREPVGYFRIVRRFARNEITWPKRRGFLDFTARDSHSDMHIVDSEMLKIAWRELICQRLEAQS